MTEIIKTEMTDPNVLDIRILNSLQSNPEGITNQNILDDLPGFTTTDIVNSLNNLFQQRHPIAIAKKSNGELLYKLQKTSTTASSSKGSDNEEKLVLKLIAEAGNKGIWNKHIHDQSKIVVKQLDKIFKNLESKKLIKRVTSVAASRRKIYMLYDLEADKSVTGGTWYSDQRFDSEYVELINQCCLRILQQKSNTSNQVVKLDPLAHRNSTFMSSSDILKVLTESNVSKVQLNLSDIEAILQTLVFDGKIDKNIATSTTGDQTNLYRAVSNLIRPTGLMSLPCGHCPLVNECREGGKIAPSTCEYMIAWLKF